MLTLPLAFACAFSATAAGEVAGQVVPKLPAVPPIQLPSLPETPQLEPPSQLEVPSVPQVPAVPVPRPSVPSPSVPDTPVTPRSTSPAAPSAGATTTATPSAGAPAATSSSTPARSSAERASRRRAADRRRVATNPRERRFQRSVKSLWACSYAIGGFERSVLVRRAGLVGFAPASAADVASRLNVSVQRVRSAQRSGLRRLRGANRADGCAMSAPADDLGSSTKTLFAVATAPPLASDAGDAVAKAPERRSANDRVEVLGARRASTGVKAATAPRATVTLASAGDGAPSPWLLIVLALIAIAVATPLLLRRRHESAPEARAPQAIAPLPPRDPDLWFDMEPWAPHRPEPPPEPAEPLPPAMNPQSPAPPDQSPAPRHGAARAAGLAATGLASLAVTLVMRSRRKR